MVQTLKGYKWWTWSSWRHWPSCCLRSSAWCVKDASHLNRSMLRRSTAQPDIRPRMRSITQPDTDTNTPAHMQHATPMQQHTTASGFDSAPASDVPLRFAGFDAHAFAQQARDHFQALQSAWNQRDLTAMQSYIAPALYAALEQQMQQAIQNGEGATEVNSVEAHCTCGLQWSNRDDKLALLWHLLGYEKQHHRVGQRYLAFRARS